MLRFLNGWADLALTWADSSGANAGWRTAASASAARTGGVGGLLVSKSADSGTSTSDTAGPPGTMTDSGKTWTVDQWVGYICTCGGKTITIASNTATVLTGTAGWSGGGSPVDGSTYTITSAGTGGYEEYQIGTGTGKWLSETDGGMNWQLGPGFYGDDYVRVMEWVFDYWTDMGAGTNSGYLFRLFNVATGFAGVQVNTGRVPTLTATAGNITLPALTASTWYRFRIRAEVRAPVVGSPDGHMSLSLWVYSEASYTCVGFASGITNTVPSTGLDRFRIGYQPLVNLAAFQVGAQQHKICNLIVIDNQDPNGTGLFTTDPGSGMVLAASRPNGAGAFSELTPTGSGTNYQNVDETTVDVADFNTTVAAGGLNRDTYDFANYGGGDTPKALAVMVHHDSGTGLLNDVFHSAGIYDGTNHINAELPASTSAVYTCIPIGEISGGGAISGGSWLTDAEISFIKHTNFGGLNSKDIYYAVVQVMDDDGLAISSPSVAKGSKRGHAA